MPWEKNFDIAATLDKAMRAFWTRGFAATSIQDLVECTGINRASLYATYGDKRALFLAALELYDRRERRAKLDELERRHPPLDAIGALFTGFITPCAKRRGCFLTNTALEMAPHDREIGRRVAAAQADLEAFFKRLIERGQQDGSVSSALDPAAAAAGLLAALLGLMVLARSRPEPALLNAVAADACERLRPRDTTHRRRQANRKPAVTAE